MSDETITMKGMAEELGLSLSRLSDIRYRNHYAFPTPINGGCGRKFAIYSRADFLNWKAKRERGGKGIEVFDNALCVSFISMKLGGCDE